LIDGSFDIDLSSIEELSRKMRPRLSKAGASVQVKMMSIVIRDSDPFVPFDTGTLSKTPMAASDKADGQIVYDTPYAKRMYYGDGYNFSPDSHPQATSRWFEHAKSEHMTEWERDARKLMKETF
jgi:hypothetical protein